MTKRLFSADIEGDGLLHELTKLYVASYSEFDSSMKEISKEPKSLTKMGHIKQFFGNPDHILIMHNGYAYDGPAVEKILGIEVKAEIVDTLFLSWYLYPKLVKHGLGYWGEELGIAKPDIDDWENLSLEEYVHRCEEDVKIQSMLWKQIWNHLMLLYGTPEGCWHVIRHLNFKAKCAAMQEKAKWKLDVPRCEKLEAMFQDKYDAAKVALECNMPDVPVYVKKNRPKKPYKVNGELSAIGEKWVTAVRQNINEIEYDNPVDYDGEIKIIKSYKEPNAGSSKQLKDWLFTMGWVPESFKYKRNKETNEVTKIPQIKDPDTEELCESIVQLIPKESSLEFLREMSVVKHRLGVVSGFLKNVDGDGYVYAAIQGLTNTLRFKHKICVNLPSVRKPYGAEIRGLLTAADSSTELCGSDMSSLEDRTKQHFMWKYDPEYVMEMQSPDFDPHLDMALAASLLSPEDAKWYKDYDDKTATEADHHRREALAKVRHAGKGTNYAATYGATGPTIARTAGVDEETGDILHAAYWDRNWSLVRIADECIVKNSRGMKWLWNPVAKIWMFLKAEKDRFSTLNQSTGTYAFDRWVYHMLERRPQLTAQFHDEVVLELKKGFREPMTKILKVAVGKVNDELNLDRELDCDVDFGFSYADIH